MDPGPTTTDWRTALRGRAEAIRRWSAGRSMRAAPGELPSLEGWTTGSGPDGGRPDIAVLVYRGVSSTEVELVADALARPLNGRVRLVSSTGGSVVAVEPARRLLTERLDAVPEPYGLVVPGGLGWKREATSPEVADWLRAVVPRARGVLAVSTGSLLLASSGHLAERDATGHWLGGALLAEMGARPSGARIVRARRLVTATGARSGMEAAAELAREMRFGPQ